MTVMVDGRSGKRARRSLLAFPKRKIGRVMTSLSMVVYYTRCRDMANCSEHKLISAEWWRFLLVCVLAVCNSPHTATYCIELCTYASEFSRGAISTKLEPCIGSKQEHAWFGSIVGLNKRKYVQKPWKNRVRIQDVGPSLNRRRLHRDLFTVNFTKLWDFSVSKWCNSVKVRWEEERGETFSPCFLFHQYSPCVVNEHQHKYTHWGFWNAPCALSPDHLCLCNLLQQHCTYSLALLKSCLHSLNVL